jgi:hypothetical protein
MLSAGHRVGGLGVLLRRRPPGWLSSADVAQHFTEEELKILPVTIRILLRSGVTHANVEKTVRPECDAATGMILRDSFHLDEPTRGRS